MIVVGARVLKLEKLRLPIGKLLGNVVCLAPGGMISLLVRHGHRKASHVEAVPELLDAVVALVLATEKTLDLRLLQSNPIAYGDHRLNQPGLGQSRVPATHLLLARSS